MLQTDKDNLKVSSRGRLSIILLNLKKELDVFNNVLLD